MSEMKIEQELRRIARRVRDLEDSRRRLAIEVAQLRTSHSYRLGQAFVLFAKRRNPLALRRLVSDVVGAFRPQNGDAPALPPRFFSPLLSDRSSLRGSLEGSVASAPVGTSILARTAVSDPRVVGIMRPDVAAAIGDAVRATVLPFDRYDAEWPILRPTHLVIDVDGLRDVWGWEHAFMLTDPSTTVEMAALLMRAKGLGVRTVLVEPSEPYRFPLLSRARSLFDVCVARGDVDAAVLTGERRAHETSGDV